MKKENIPNALTLIRVVMIPIFIAILSLSHSYLGHIVAAVIFAIASITDYLDGFLARKWNVVSNFGKFADPMAKQKDNGKHLAKGFNFSWHGCSKNCTTCLNK